MNAIAAICALLEATYLLTSPVWLFLQGSAYMSLSTPQLGRLLLCRALPVRDGFPCSHQSCLYTIALRIPISCESSGAER